MTNTFHYLKELWKILYDNKDMALLESFFEEITGVKQNLSSGNSSDWYKDAVVYSLYVDLFNKDFQGLIEKLDYLQDLGVSCLWLLPILDSPMRDAGFDIRNYRKIRSDLLALPDDAPDEQKIQLFRNFLENAHQRGIHVIFDIAINHTSNEHPWFVEARKSEDNPYRDYYIWSKDTSLYKETRLLFEGMCPSNWEKDGEWYYFHRFFEFQPDLNYRNPRVLVEMTRNLLFWVQQGVDGFRADAIPYLWKEDGTDCENLPQTHTIVKFFRAVLDYVRPGTLLLAEACQPPREVVKYIGTGDECHAGYHFPLMPQIFKALAQKKAEPVVNILNPTVTPTIPDDSQWFTFLRCHDELSLEKVYVNEEDRAFIHGFYCRKPEWDFRVGQGISARLSELLEHNPDKLNLAFSIMLTLPGTPVIYYGDEFAKTNDEQYYQEQIQLTGKNDTRFLVRGKIDWQEVEAQLRDKNSVAARVFFRLRQMIRVRNRHKAFGRGSLYWLHPVVKPESSVGSLLIFERNFHDETLIIIHNLGEKTITVENPGTDGYFIDLLNENEIRFPLAVQPLGYLWLKKDIRN